MVEVDLEKAWKRNRLQGYRHASSCLKLYIIVSLMWKLLRLSHLLNCMPIPLQSSIIYGPIQSRRLGVSLGVNILPGAVKTCNFNCVYCQYGSTKARWDTLVQRTNWPSLAEILSETEKAIRSLTISPDYLTLAGNGEPTAHPRFREIVEGLCQVRDNVAPKAKTAILSNASFLGNPDVRHAIESLDLKILKLDCGEGGLFLRYNRPTNHISFDSIVRDLRGMENVTVQTLFTGGPHGNDNPASVDRWVHYLKSISLSTVQIYSLDRDCEDRSLRSLSREELFGIKRRLQKEGIPAEIF